MFPELLVNEECLADDSCDTWGIEYNPSQLSARV